VRGGPAFVAVHDVEKDHGVVGFAAEEFGFADGNFGAEAKVLSDGAVIEFEEVDDRCVVKQREEEGGAESAVGDDQVGLDIGGGLEGVEDAVGMGDGVFKIAGEDAVAEGGSAAGFVEELADAGEIAFDAFGAEGALPAEFIDQARRDISELGGKILMDEQNVHRKTLLMRGFSGGRLYCGAGPGGGALGALEFGFELLRSF